MTYAQFHDGFYKNRKVRRVGPEAAWLWAASIGYSNENLTDGFIPVENLGELIEMDSKPRAKLIAKLVDAQLWEVVEGGWKVHDFLNWNFSRDQVIAKRQANLDRVNKHRGKVANVGDGNNRVMRYNDRGRDGDSPGDNQSEKQPSSEPLVLDPKDHPPTPFGREGAATDPMMTKPAPPPVPVAPTIDPDSTDPTDLLNAIADASNNTFDRFSGAGGDAEIQFHRRLLDYKFNVRRARLLGAVIAKHETTMPKMWVKRGEKVRMQLLMGCPNGANGQRGGTWLSVAVAAVEAQEAAEARRAATVTQRAAAPIAPPMVAVTADEAIAHRPSFMRATAPVVGADAEVTRG